MKGTAAAMAIAALFTLTACGSPPGDTITEIEVVTSGDGKAVSVETYDGREWPMREGLPCSVDDRLWGADGMNGGRDGCADKDDLLIEQDNARDGDGEDREHEGEESDDPDQS